MALNQFLFVFCVVATTFLGLFQLGLALGAPMGDYAWAGRFQNSLPTYARVISAIYSLVLFATAGHSASLQGWLPSLLSHWGQVISVWLLLGFWVVNMVGNLMSRGTNEKTRISLVSGALLVATALLIANNS
jgi:hypothetical protein